MVSEAGGPPGDLFVPIHRKPDARFDRRSADLWHRVSIDVANALPGTTWIVPALDMPTTVTVLSDTQPDIVLRLRGKRLSEFGIRCRGEPYLWLTIQRPKQRTLKKRELYERLRALAGK